MSDEKVTLDDMYAEAKNYLLGLEVSEEFAQKRGRQPSPMMLDKIKCMSALCQVLNIARKDPRGFREFCARIAARGDMNA